MSVLFGTSLRTLALWSRSCLLILGEFLLPLLFKTLTLLLLFSFFALSCLLLVGELLNLKLVFNIWLVHELEVFEVHTLLRFLWTRRRFALYWGEAACHRPVKHLDLLLGVG